mgnify:CR=1 FL=1
MECGRQKFLQTACTCLSRTANRRRESFEANWEHFFYAAFGIGFRVFPRFDNPRKMSDNRRQWADFLDLLRDVNTIFDFFA